MNQNYRSLLHWLSGGVLGAIIGGLWSAALAYCLASSEHNPFRITYLESEQAIENAQRIGEIALTGAAFGLLHGLAAGRGTRSARSLAIALARWGCITVMAGGLAAVLWGGAEIAGEFLGANLRDPDRVLVVDTFLDAWAEQSAYHLIPACFTAALIQSVLRICRPRRRAG